MQQRHQHVVRRVRLNEHADHEQQHRDQQIEHQRIGCQRLQQHREFLRQEVDREKAEHAIEGDSVAELLRGLEREHPATSGWILDERGAVRRHIAVIVNGELGDPEMPVAADVRVDVLPALSGGR